MVADLNSHDFQMPKMNIFKDINAYPDEWVGATTDDKEKGHLIIRINTGIKEAIGHPSYPMRMGVAVTIESETIDHQMLYELEDKIEEYLNKVGTLCLVITGVEGSRFRELVYYCTIQKKILILKASMRKYKNHFHGLRSNFIQPEIQSGRHILSLWHR